MKRIILKLSILLALSSLCSCTPEVEKDYFYMQVQMHTVRIESGVLVHEDNDFEYLINVDGKEDSSNRYYSTGEEYDYIRLFPGSEVVVTGKAYNDSAFFYVKLYDVRKGFYTTTDLFNRDFSHRYVIW